MALLVVQARDWVVCAGWLVVVQMDRTSQVCCVFLVRGHSSYCQPVIVSGREGSISFGLSNLVVSLGRIKTEYIWRENQEFYFGCVIFWRSQFGTWKYASELPECVRVGHTKLEVTGIDMVFITQRLKALTQKECTVEKKKMPFLSKRQSSRMVSVDRTQGRL